MDNVTSHLANEDIYSDDEFFSFLMKAKENFEKLSPESHISQLEKDLERHYEEELSSQLSQLEGNFERHCEEEFSSFLTKTKAIFEELDAKSETDQEDDDESDLMFMKFITQMKEGLPNSLDKENQSPFSLKYSSPQRKQRSFSLTTDEKKDVSLKEKRCKSVSIDESFDLSDESEASADFVYKRETYSRQLYNYFNKKIFNNRLQEDMILTWSNLLRSTAGRTHCKRQADVYWCKIELSSKVLTSFDRLRDTLLHEMCHAAVWIVNKSRDRHGPLWQTWASRCKLILPHIDVPSRCHNYEISYAFTYKCKKCQWKCGRHSRSIKLQNVVCPQCRSQLTLIKS